MSRTRNAPCLAALTALVAVLACTALASPASAAPRSFFGLQAWYPPSDTDFQRMGRAHTGTFRSNLTWATIEPTRGARLWTGYDRMVASAARAGITTLPVIYGSPRFAAQRTTYPPRSSSAKRAFAAFVRDAVARYGRGGSFWAANRSLPYRPVRAWQIWNEPNFPAYWFGKPNARQYMSLVRATRNAVRSKDQHAKIVLAGLAETANGVPVPKFLKSVYRTKGAKKAFDVVAIHPYARNYKGVLGAVKRARKVMRKYHDTRTQVWVTEVGWATAGKVSKRTKPFRTTKKGQASKLKTTYRAMSRYRKRYRIAMVVWFALRDRAQRGGERNYWAINTGLFTKTGVVKPAWRTFAHLAGGQP
jgi:hypothetical protein